MFEPWKSQAAAARLKEQQVAVGLRDSDPKRVGRFTEDFCQRYRAGFLSTTFEPAPYVDFNPRRLAMGAYASQIEVRV